MICRIEDLKKISQILLMAVDTSDTSRLTENLELKVSDGVLTLSVTNGEYLVKARILFSRILISMQQSMLSFSLSSSRRLLLRL